MFVSVCAKHWFGDFSELQFRINTVPVSTDLLKNKVNFLFKPKVFLLVFVEVFVNFGYLSSLSA